MNNDLISRSALKERKFVGNKYMQIGGRTNGKTLENMNRAYQQGWNDAIDAIIDNAPTVEERPQGECGKCEYRKFSQKFADDIVELMAKNGITSYKHLIRILSKGGAE